MSTHENPFLAPPDSFNVDLGPARDDDHYEAAHDEATLALHSDDVIDPSDAELVLDIDLDGFDLDSVGLGEALDAFDRRGGRL